MDRRDLLRAVPLGAAVAATTSARFAAAQEKKEAKTRGLPPLKITNVETILTAPNRIRLVVVKVSTDEPGLHGYGCATFTQRAYAVKTAVDQYLKPFLIGRNPDEIEDVWQASYVSSYWRNGPVLFNAMSGVDMALWDIKGKRADMPVYQLLGGRCRLGADLYLHVSGRDFKEVEDGVRSAIERGYRHVRVQVGIPGQATYGAARAPEEPATPIADGPTNPKYVWEPAKYLRTLPKLFEHLRTTVGEDVELLHDVHERVSPNQGINLCKELEKYHLFFLEDPLSPEDKDYFAQLRAQTCTPIAMGELFNTQQEYLPLISGRLIDYIRIHISQIGGLSPARKVAALSEYFGVKTAWHGPGDCSPVGHAAGLHLELAVPNFGIHEGHVFAPETREVFRGCPEVKNGYMLATDAPGLGIEVDEKLAAKFPFPNSPTFDHRWGSTRRRDGTIVKP